MNGLQLAFFITFFLKIFIGPKNPSRRPKMIAIKINFSPDLPPLLYSPELLLMFCLWRSLSSYSSSL